MRSFPGCLFGSLDGLDFLEEEGANDSGLDASSAENSSVWPGDGLVLLGQSLIVVGPELSNAVDSLAAVAAIMRGARAVSSLGDVLHNNS